MFVYCLIISLVIGQISAEKPNPDLKVMCAKSWKLKGHNEHSSQGDNSSCLSWKYSNQSSTYFEYVEVCLFNNQGRGKCYTTFCLNFCNNEGLERFMPNTV